MRTLQVQDFSCIKDATLELGKLTLIIGPQASGKSVLCKLSFFLIEIAQNQAQWISKKESFDKFVEGVKTQFVDWFPRSAWGDKQFKIHFKAGDYSISLMRKKYKGQSTDDFRVKFSDEFKAQYESLLSQVDKLSKKPISEISVRWELEYKLRELASGSLKKLMNRDHVGFQAFVPAGRSFFTSIGKAIAAFEEGRVLDPLILRFGRIYTSMREHGVFLHERQDPQSRKIVEKVLEELLGGKIERDGEKEMMRTTDGRRMPLSALSSGQQELLPLITLLPWFMRPNEDRLCYIEEPEAHLFPAAQSKLIETLVYANASPASASLVITTHSPYVLTKANNLLKAGAISRKLSDDGKKELEAIIPRRAWLLARNVRAYAIRDQQLVSILESDGFIDADYLDDVSGELGKEFGRLLELEEKVG